MNRRRFLSTMGAAVAALFVPLPTDLPILTAGFVRADEYLAFVHPANVADLRALAGGTLFSGEIGRYEGVRFIESRSPWAN